MAGDSSGLEGRGMPAWAIVVIVLLIAAGAYYYITYMQAPAEAEDIYGPQLEELNDEIYRATTSASVETARQKAEALKEDITGIEAYEKYLPLAEAQLAVLDMIDLNLEYISEADAYAEEGVDCSVDYSGLVSDMQGAETSVHSAKSKVNSWLYENPDSDAAKLLTRLDDIDTEGMAIFAEFMERDYSKSCVEPQEPAAAYATPLSKEDATDLVVAEVVGENNYYVYMIDEPLSSGDTITFLRDEGDYNLTVEEETWFFYVDTEPFAPFDHDTMFVLVSVNDATYSVYSETYHPVINDIYYWSTYEERLDPDNIAYPENATVELVAGGTDYDFISFFYSLAAPGSNIPAGTPVPFADELCCEGIGKKYALVVTGYDEPMFRSDTAGMYSFLKGQGYSDADINYLTTRATDADSDGVTTIRKVADGFKHIMDNAQCCDEVFIYISGHGNNVRHWEYKHKTTGEKVWIRNLGQLEGGVANWEATGNTGNYHRVTLNPRFTTPAAGGGTVSHGSADGGRAMSYEFAYLLDRIKSCYVTFMYFSCYSGTAAPTLAGKGRTIITPTSTDRVAWGYHTNGSVFTNFWTQAQTDAGVRNDVDTNRDGKVSDKEAFNWAKKKANDWAKNTVNKSQEGTLTESTERCRCCHVICDDASICSVAEGEGTDSPLCPKVGDYCGTIERPPPEEPEDWIPPEEPPEDEPPEEEECGDGKITGAEECDWASTSTNKCPEGKYCKDCKCKDLETSVVCGDGKISSPDEECDGGNVQTNICPEGYRCQICKCEPVESQCGDGRIDPPEECDHGNTATKECDDPNEICQDCQCIPREEATHRECVDEQCVEVQGYGEDQCYSDSQCLEPTHTECQDNKCVEVKGEGTDECSTDEDCEEEAVCGDGDIEGWEECEEDDDCAQDEFCVGCMCLEIPAYCGDGNLDTGEECEYDEDCGTGGVCSSGCTCVYPPELDCPEICSEMGLPIVIGHGYPDSGECAEAASEEPTTCYTTCIKSGFYRVDNIAGWDSCCCKKKEMFPCDDCPGQNPVCPECPSEYQ